jgi:hypothetical protein
MVLGWLIDIKAMTIHLPPHHVKRLAEMLASIPITQEKYQHAEVAQGPRRALIDGSRSPSSHNLLSQI